MTLAGALGDRLQGLLECIVLATFRWWIGLMFFVGWTTMRTPLRHLLANRALLARRALMPETPLLVVLDEPSASLDAPTEAALFRRYRAAAQRLGEANGTITIVVSHRSPPCTWRIRSSSWRTAQLESAEPTESSWT